MRVTAWAPGRVNLIGDHTDYTGGMVLPMAIDLGTTVVGETGGDLVRLTSLAEPDPAVVPLDVVDPSLVQPPWARYVAGVVAEIRPRDGFEGEVHTTLPIGGGLSSSAALEVAVALALGFEGTPLELARLCRDAEQRSSGVPCGLMDQLASVAGVDGHALLIDCFELSVVAIPFPPDLEVRVIDSGQTRTLASSAYAQRRAECSAAEEVVGPLRLLADASAVSVIADPVARRRARHVITENQRVRDACSALRAGDPEKFGSLMLESHASLKDDFEVSTPVLDDLVERLVGIPGVFGARLTGAGFGGCVVALTRPGALDEGIAVKPSAGARRDLPTRE